MLYASKAFSDASKLDAVKFKTRMASLDKLER